MYTMRIFQRNFESETMQFLGDRLEADEDSQDDDLFRNFALDELDLPDQMISRKRGLESQTMGLRFPMWFTACHHMEFLYRLCSEGVASKNSDMIRLASLSNPASAAMQANKDLAKLAAHLTKFLQEQYHEVLAIPVRQSLISLQSIAKHERTWTRHTICFV